MNNITIMANFYHYTLRRLLPEIQRSGIYPNHPYFTTTEYYHPGIAGQALGVMEHNIDCVLIFKDDGLFRRFPDVPSTTRFTGGGNQYQHPLRPKPIAIRNIIGGNWVNL